VVVLVLSTTPPLFSKLQNKKLIVLHVMLYNVKSHKVFMKYARVVLETTLYVPRPPFSAEVVEGMMILLFAVCFLLSSDRNVLVTLLFFFQSPPGQSPILDELLENGGHGRRMGSW
jgi:hypothetical protein